MTTCNYLAVKSHTHIKWVTYST